MLLEIEPLPSPSQLKELLPLSSTAVEFLFKARGQAKEILQRKDTRRVVIVGPCSIHDPESCIEYAKRLRLLAKEIEETIFVVMRLFIEKPRTRFGWKGLLYDPLLDGSHRIDVGLNISRSLFVEMAEMGLPCATELLDPLVIPYIEDLVTWGFIGARTGASQPHRQAVSGLSFPVGFKNDLHGRFDTAISGILASRISHSHLSLDPEGRVAAVQTFGNPFTHLVLRGADNHSNFDPVSIDTALQMLKAHYLEPRLLIDCSHGNCHRDYLLQIPAFRSTLELILQEHNEGLFGWMLESFLQEGKQPLDGQLQYGTSITDACLNWEQTETLLLEAHEKLLNL